VAFQSFEYVLGFLPILLGLYLIVRRSRVLSTLVLVIGSGIFYAWKTVWWLAPLVVAATVDYFVGVKMSSDTTDDRVRRRWLILSLVVNLSLLSAFKYLGWLTLSLNSLAGLFGLTAVIPVISTTLPPGISFYTFETMSYTIDVYRRHFKPERSYLIYLNFVLFFPHLVAGPILRPGDLIGQLKVVRPVATPDEVRLALCQILWGLFKKIALADNFGDIVGYAVHAVYTPPFDSGGVGLLYAVGFALQIYCDFSAYSDIARGSALLFGIKLPRNFLTPLFAKSPREFWTRWHITLSTWIRDYVYIPLGGNKGTLTKQCTTMIVTMGLGGLWHGAGLMFIAWGLYHGALILIYRLRPIEAVITKSEAGLRAVAVGSVFFGLNLFGWMMFRAGSGHPSELGKMLLTFTAFRHPLDLGAFLHGAGPLALLASILFATELFAYKRNTEFPEVLCGLRTIPLATVLTCLWFFAIIFAKRSGYDFIYFAF